MFARVDLYAERARRPGLARIATALFQTTVIALVFALASGQHFSSYYIFYGSLVFGIVYLAGLRHLYTRVTGHLLAQAGYRRRALLVGSGDHIDDVAHALAGNRPLPGQPGRLHRADAPARERPALARPLRSALRGPRRGRDRRRDHRRPRLPARPRRSSWSTDCHQRGVSVHVVPSTMEILTDRAEFVPGVAVPLFTLRPPVFEGTQFALKRSFDLVIATAAAARAVTGPARDRDRRAAHLAGPDHLPLAPAGHGRAPV